MTVDTGQFTVTVDDLLSCRGKPAVSSASIAEISYQDEGFIGTFIWQACHCFLGVSAHDFIWPAATVIAGRREDGSTS